MQITPDQEKLFQIFFPYVNQNQQKALKENQRFVHYTSAETAMSIIRSKEIWMRNATCMNDFMEIQYGLNCLFDVYKSAIGQRYAQMLNNMFPGIGCDIATMFNSWSGSLRNDTYLTCVSEHKASEDVFGRLSMWRFKSVYNSRYVSEYGGC